MAAVPPRWLVDEMLGRLARYLRFVGGDVVYLQGLADEKVRDRARAEGRVLVTRDRELARRVPHAVLLTSPLLGEQWAELRRQHPEIPTDLRFERCTLCNGALRALPPSAPDPPDRRGRPLRHAPGVPRYGCEACGHVYWEGTHTAKIRAQLAAWSTRS